MSEVTGGSAPVLEQDDAISLFAFASVMFRWRRAIIALGLLGAAVGLAKGLTSTRVYTSVATFIPQGSEGGVSGLALAASQFGIRVPSGGSGWGPTVYVELLRSAAVLGPIALDTLVVAEESGRRVAVTDLLEIEGPTIARRTELAVKSLAGMVAASEDMKLGAVRLSVTSRWPSVSLALAERLVRGVNQFNLQTRKSQAAAERQFVEVQAAEAERALRGAEDRLQSFLQRNRSGITGSPILSFEHDRLQRDVGLRQQMYNSLLQSREEARIREVRDTPVITVFEEPALPVVGEPRRTLQKGILGGLSGGMLGVIIAFVIHGLSSARRMPSEEAREFFRLVEDAKPRFLKRRG